jgi:hypothetical protein
MLRMITEINNYLPFALLISILKAIPTDHLKMRQIIADLC